MYVIFIKNSTRQGDVTVFFVATVYIFFVFNDTQCMSTSSDVFYPSVKYLLKRLLLILCVYWLILQLLQTQGIMNYNPHRRRSNLWSRNVRALRFHFLPFSWYQHDATTPTDKCLHKIVNWTRKNHSKPHLPSAPQQKWDTYWSTHITLIKNRALPGQVQKCNSRTVLVTFDK